ncbi:La-related protein 1C [Bienertia sinuspersici]
MAASTTTSASTATDSPRNGLPSPWAQVVKGAGDSPENSESISKEDIPANDGNVGKKPAWNKPSNAVSPPLPSQPNPDHQPAVMGAASWPALSESTRLPLKSSDSPKSTPEISLGPTTTNPQQPKQDSANTHQNSSVNSAPPTRQRSMKRGGGGGSGNRQGGFVRDPPPPPPLPVPEMAQSNFNKVVPMAGSDSSSRETRPIGGFASHQNASNDHSNHRGSSRRGNFGRGNGRNNYHGGRRDQDHGNHDWSSPASPQGGRGAHGHHHRPQGRGFMGPPVQGPPPFGPPSPVRQPYGNAVVYPDPPLVYYYPQPLPADSFRGMGYITGPPPPPYLVAAEALRSSIVTQIDYYFSDANLVKDQYLRSKMDEQGWVPITLIANFPRVQNLSDNISFILDCLSGSSIVEVQGDKIRRRDEWMKWITHQRSPSNSGSQSPVGSYDNLSKAVQEVSSEQPLEQNQSSALNEKEATDNLRVTTLEGSIQYMTI